MRLMAKVAMMAAAAIFLSGCSTFHARLDNSQRLMLREDFHAAKAAAPEWCRDALKTINALEMEIEKQ